MKRITMRPTTETDNEIEPWFRCKRTTKLFILSHILFTADPVEQSLPQGLL